jgi:capsular exopolysaccharide synthesis family protein
MKTSEFSLIMESFRTLASNLLFSNKNTPPPKSILFTSSGPQEGKSTIISNLAITLSQAGKKVLLVDADLRRPVLHTIFNLMNNVGLSDLVTGSVKELKAEAVIEPNLSVLPSGTKILNPSQLLNSEKMKSVIELILERAVHLYDVILLDSSPILAVTDTELLSSLVDNVVLVICTDKVTKNEAKRTKAILKKVDAKILGTVLNKFNEELGFAYHPYSAMYLR